MRRTIQQKELRLRAALQARQLVMNEVLGALYKATKKLDKVRGRLRRLERDYAVGGKYHEELLLGSRTLADRSKRSV